MYTSPPANHYETRKPSPSDSTGLPLAWKTRERMNDTDEPSNQREASGDRSALA
jgi:hypothetical protein